MTKPGGIDDPQKALTFIRTILGRSNGIQLDKDSEREVRKMLEVGQKQLGTAHRGNEYDTFVRQLTTSLSQNLPHAIQEERRSTDQLPLTPMVIRPELFQAGLSSICPLWPFC